MKRKRNCAGIQQEIFRTHLMLIAVLALLLSLAGGLINLHTETQRRDQNLQNIAESAAHSALLTEETDSAILTDYFDSLKNSLGEVDVISVVDENGVRLYHSNHALIGTSYDGTLPDFSRERRVYAENDRGPSGTQRRAYAAIYDSEGNYAGFVIAVMLQVNIRAETLRSLLLFGAIALAAVALEMLLSMRLSQKIKGGLMGYEPDAFSAMFKIRDNILESLEEGVVAVNRDGKTEFVNRAASRLLGPEGANGSPGIGRTLLGSTLESGKKELAAQESFFAGAEVLVDRMPILENGNVTGAVAILHDRTEYTRLMEDLAGTRYLVDSMRANNHDFTNKLHVILGLIRMERYDEAAAYIESITIVQRQMISRIMHAVDEPAVAALLIGKISRASECNVEFVLREGSAYARADLPLPPDALVTIVGNLIDNALDAMNCPGGDYGREKELLFGIFSRPGALLITVDDTGCGICAADLPRIFDNGFSTKGEGHGMGLWQTKKLVESYGGVITAESQEGVGTSFSVSFRKNMRGGESHV